MLILAVNVNGQCYISTDIHTSAPDGICPGQTATLTANASGASTDCCPDEPLTGNCWDKISNAYSISCNNGNYRAVYKLDMRERPNYNTANSYCKAPYTSSFIANLSGSQAGEGYFFERHDRSGFIKAEFTYLGDPYIFYMNFTNPGQLGHTHNICQLGPEFTTNSVPLKGYTATYINCRTGARSDYSYTGEPVYTNFDPATNTYIIFGWYDFGTTTWYFEKLTNGANDLAHCDCQDTEEENTYQWSTGATTESINVNTQGTYSVTVTDCEGCSSTSTITVGACGVTVGDKIFLDQDGDGFQDFNDPGVSNVRINLIDVGADGIAHTADDKVVESTTSDAKGRYAFEQVKQGNYCIQVINLSLPANTSFTKKDVSNNQIESADSDVDANGKSDLFKVGVSDITHIDAGIVNRPPTVYNLSVNDASINENAGTGSFQICIDKPSTQPVTVQYNTSNGTALSGSDYTGVNGTATIPAGQTCTSVNVPIIDDQIDEPNETFTVTLSNPQNATIVDGQGTVTIVDNDNPPVQSSISVSDINVNENGGTASVQICLNQATNQAVTVQYNTLNGTAQGGTDYVISNGTALIPAGQTCTTVNVPIIDDNIDEPNETFTVNLFNPQNATIVDGQGTVTIVDNDNPTVHSTISINDINVNENGGTATLNICINQATNQPVSVQYNTLNGSAQGGADYVTANGTAVIPAGQTCTSVNVPIIDDNIDEPNETFTVNLFNPQNGTIVDGQGTVTILDNDNTTPPPPSGSCTDVLVTGGNGQVTITNIPQGAKVEIQGPSTGWGLQLVCNGNCSSTQVVNNLSTGAYKIKVQTFNPYCYKQIDATVTGGGGNPCANQGGDSDGDGICNNVDNCPNVSNPDQKDSNHNGIGDACEVVSPCANQGGDSDGDGVCNNVDNCPNVSNPDQKDSNHNGIGDACEQPSGGNTCKDVRAVGGNGQITITNIPSKARVELSGAPLNWAPRIICDGNCSPTQIVNNLAPGQYFLKIQTFNPYCYAQINVTVHPGGGGNPCANQGGDSDGDGVCNNVDNCPNVSNPDQKDSNKNGVGDACETVPPPTGGNACSKVQASLVNGRLTVSGLSAPIVILKVFDSNWQTIFECTGNKCPETVIFSPDANERTCHVDIKFYTSNWQFICERSVKVTANGGALNRNAKRLNFEALQSERTVSLQWVSNTGWKNSHFELERSTDGETFEKIDEVSNKDMTDDLAYYEQADKSPAVGKNYYRLKQVYQTGDHDYTEVKTVDFGIDLEKVSVFPNPAKTELFVNLKNLVGKKGNIQLTNQYGQVVKEVNMEQIETEMLKINTADYTNGLYYLQIQLENQAAVVRKVMIHRLY
jgi:hypothetical protein